MRRAVTAALLWLGWSVALAQAPATGAAGPAGPWPNRPIAIVVPFGPGGSNDIFARAVAQELSLQLKQQVIVENRAGAGGMLGAGYVAKSAPDGYTLMLASSTFTIGGALKSGLPFDPRKDVTPLALVAKGPMLLVSSTSLAARSTQELIALARAHPGKLTYGSAGSGSVNQLSIEMLATMAGMQLVQVPYKGGAQAMNDVMANHVDLYLGSLPQLMPQVRAGKLRALGVTSPQRARQAPEVPTLSEAVPGYSLELWWGMFAPGNMPRELVARLNAEINKALQAPTIRQYMENEAAVPGNATPEQFGALVESELVNWQTIAKQANIRLE